MFVGHLAVSLGAKVVEPKAPLAALVAASFGLDLLWPLLLLAGVVERPRRVVLDSDRRRYLNGIDETWNGSFGSTHEVNEHDGERHQRDHGERREPFIDRRPKGGSHLVKLSRAQIRLELFQLVADHEEHTPSSSSISYLKPDNMMVGEDGRIKVLDFGLAKPTSGFVGGDADSALPTAAKTAEGMIVGTLN